MHDIVYSITPQGISRNGEIDICCVTEDCNTESLLNAVFDSQTARKHCMYI